MSNLLHSLQTPAAGLAPATLLVLLSTGALAAQTACDSALTQTEINQCASKQAAASDHRLGQLLSELEANSDSSRVSALRQVQALWVQYRDAKCKWQSAIVEGGSMQPLEYATCFRQLTEERIAILKYRLCEAGAECDAARKYDLPHRLLQP